MCRRKRYGISLVELFVTLSIIGILGSLVLSGIVSAREAARNTKCKNSLREIAHAMLNAESAKRSFPAFYNGYTRNLSRSPLVEFLGYMENPIDGPSNAGVLEEFWPPFSVKNNGLPLICPGDGAESGTSYRVCVGSSIFADDRQIPYEAAGNGAFRGGKQSKASDFTDGLSNTIAIGERTVSSSRRNLMFILPLSERITTEFVVGNSDLVSDLPYEYAGRSVLYGSMRHNGFTVAIRPNSDQSDFLFCEQFSASSMCYAGIVASRSNHGGGVNIGFMDGGIRFISNSIDMSVWRALGTRAGGESFDSDILQ